MMAAISRAVAERGPAGRVFLLLLLLAFASVPVLAAPPACSSTLTRLCLGANRFQAEVTWMAPGLGSGLGKALALTGDTGLFWFFTDSNLELTVKVLDGRAINRHFWVYYGGLSDVQYTLTITDLQTGAQAVYQNPEGHLASAADTSAFNEEAPPAAARAARTAAPDTAAILAPPFLGPEFQANVTTAGDQTQPAVAIAADGSYMIAWTSTPDPGNLPIVPRSDVYGRVYDADGTPRGGEIQLNTTVTTSQRGPRVAANAAGQFMAVWSDGGEIIRARIFSASGTPMSDELMLGSGSNDLDSPDVTGDPAGGFLAVWHEEGSVLENDHIYWQRFDAQGAHVGGENGFSIQGVVTAPRLATSPLGGFLLAWGSSFPAVDFALANVFAARLDAAGSAQEVPFQVNDQALDVAGFSRVRPVIYGDGTFSVLWTSRQIIADSGTLFGRRFGADATPTGTAVALRSGPAIGSPPAAVALPSGSTWVLWEEAGQLQDSFGVFSGVFDSSWALKTPVSRVNTYTQDSQVDPVVAASPAGIVTAWASGADGFTADPLGHEGTQDGNDYGIFGQRFTAANCALGSDQLCLGGRFRVAVQFTNPLSGMAGSGQPLQLTGDTGAFWFFGANNIELVIKVLDGRAVNGHFWVFSGALSDVDYTITITDTQTQATRTYHNPAHQLASREDLQAF
jgi:hypothetical protein